MAAFDCSKGIANRIWVSKFRLGRARSPPVVDDVETRPAIAGIILAMHGNALELGPEAAIDEAAIGLVPGHVRARQHTAHTDGHGQSAAGVE